jgi:threonine dehydrogenase-like Zn-dependent dehydrogenase
MRAAIFNGPGSITVGDRPDPTIESPTDAIVRVTYGCVCGSDLWYYRGQSPHTVGSIGHEFIGTVEELGSEVAGLGKGDLVVAPFLWCDGTCALCRAGWPSQCVNGGAFGRGTNDGGQGEFVRVPFAGSTLVRVPGSGHSHETMLSLLALSDVMGTGYHAAVSAEAGPGKTVAVVGDGAVGLSAVIASRRLGAARIISLSRNPARQKLARLFGATDIVAERGEAAVAAVKALTEGGLGVDCALECVGTGESMTTAFGIARPGTMVGAVGAPHDVEIPEEAVIFRNVGIRGGVAPVRRYLPGLIEDVLSDRINPGRVFDLEVDLEHVADGYRAMDERRAVKAAVRMVPAA